MWTMTSIGFFSAVENQNNPGELIVRARNSEDIMNLADMLDTDYEFTIANDYPYRIYCDKKKWANVLAHLAETIDYPNFKNTIADPVRHEAYGSVWFDMQMIDDREEYWSIDPT